MNALETLSRRIDRITEFLLFLFGISMSAIVVAQVFSRYVLNHSLFWSEELARYLLVWLTFLGAATAYRRGVHPGVDILHGSLRPAVRRWVNILVHLISIAFFGVMVVYGCWFAWFVRMQISPALRLPKWAILAIIPISGVLLFIHALASLFAEIKERRT